MTMFEDANIAICETAWGCEPRLVQGAEYEVMDSYFSNGERHFTVRDSNREVFTVPDVFFVFNEANYD